MNGRTLKLHVLGSGSKGNCALVEGKSGLLMVDCGLSRKETLARMAMLGLDAADVRAVIVTHEHGDHVRGLKVWCKHCAAPVFASEGTADGCSAFEGVPVETFHSGDELEVAGMRIRTFPTSHDVRNPVGFRVECAGDSLGYATDTGVVTEDAAALLSDTRMLALESNHDVAMLKHGEYPAYLKARILSETGHLSNDQAAEAARALATDRTEQIVAMHLSQDNNRPSLAVRALAGTLGASLLDDVGTRAATERLHVRAAGQNRPVTVF